jgi:hypothetical protein
LPRFARKNSALPLADQAGAASPSSDSEVDQVSWRVTVWSSGSSQICVCPPSAVEAMMEAATSPFGTVQSPEIRECHVRDHSGQAPRRVR